MTETVGLSTGYICVWSGWAGTTGLCEMLGYGCLTTLRALLAPDTLGQDAACRQAAAESGIR